MENRITIDIIYPTETYDIPEAFSAYNIFEAIKFKDGEKPEFPLDLCVGKNNDVCMSVRQINILEKQTGDDTAYIRTIDIGSSGETVEECSKMLNEKVNRQALNLLLHAGLSHNIIIEDEKEERLEALMSTTLRRMKNRQLILSNVKLKTIKYGPYIIGLNVGSRDCFMAAVRSEPEMFPDTKYVGNPDTPIHKRNKEDYIQHGYYCWTDIGFAVLNVKNVVIGKLKNEKKINFREFF